MRRCPKCGDEIMFIAKKDEVRAVFCSKCGFEWFAEEALDPMKNLEKARNDKKK